MHALPIFLLVLPNKGKVPACVHFMSVATYLLLKYCHAHSYYNVQLQDTICIIIISFQPHILLLNFVLLYFVHVVLHLTSDCEWKSSHF